MRIPRILILSASCLVACAPPRADDLQQSDRVLANHPEAPLYGDTAGIVASLASVHTLLKAEPARLKLYARLLGRSELIAVRDSLSWPAGVDVSYNIVFDSGGAPLLHVAMPTSESGDWFHAITHHFAPDGRTVFYEFYSSSFASECTETLRETVRVFIDRSTGKELARTHKLTDIDGTAISDATGCYLHSSEAPPPMRRAEDLPFPSIRR